MDSPLTFYRDSDLEEEMEAPFEFEAVKAGETEQRTVYATNDIDYEVEIRKLEVIESDGEVDVDSRPESVYPDDTEEIVFELNPRTTKLEPVSFEVEISYQYTVD